MAAEICDESSMEIEPVDLGNDKQNKKHKEDAKGKRLVKLNGNAKKEVKEKKEK